MFFRPVAQIQTYCMIAALSAFVFICLLSANQAEAQQNDGSLFVIKSPVVNSSGYGRRPSAISITPISHQQDGTTPREDDGSEDGETVEDPRYVSPKDDIDLDDTDFDDMKELEDLDKDGEEFDSKPPEVPMTTWNLKPMSSIVPGMRPVNGKSPSDQSWQLTNRSSMPIVNSEKLFAWAAPDITYKPLYFEDVALERYGQTRGFVKQPFVSGFHFLKSAVFLPYYSLYDPIDSCDGPLGYCRPGECVNCVANKHFFGNPFSGQRR